MYIVSIKRTAIDASMLISIPLEAFSFYFSVSHLEKELAGKQKLLSGVCLRLVNIGIHVDHLTHRIREKRVQLENHRLQNKQVVERYGELNQQLNSYLNTVLIDQAPNEDVQLKIPSI